MAHTHVVASDQVAKARMVLEAPVAEVPQEGRLPLVVRSLAIEPRTTTLVSRDIVDKHNRTMALARKHDLTVAFMGYAPTFNGVHIHRAAHTDWAVMPVAKDPLYQSWGRSLYVPPAVLEDMERVWDAGINFDAVFIAHEIPAGSVEAGEPIPLELIQPPPPPSTARYLNQLEAVSKAYWQAMPRLLTMPVVAPLVLGGLALGAAVAVAVGGAVALGAAAITATAYDPILFGLYVDKSRQVNGQSLALWYYLTHWYWPTE